MCECTKISKRNNKMIKIVTGVRRCGKSYLLDPIFKNYLLENGVDEEHIIKLELDSIENFEYHEPKKLYDYIMAQIKDKETYYIILDEIQLVDNFESVLNSFLRKNNLDVYVTGSNSKFLSSDVITEFRGRGDEIRVFPLTFKEYISIFDCSKDEAWNKYITYGGMPYSVMLESTGEKSKYFVDVGLRNARLNFRQQEYDHLMENLIYNELLYRGYNVDVGVVEVFEHNKENVTIRKQLEIDFVCNQGSKRYYIQSAYNIDSKEKEKQEMRSLKNVNDFFKKVIVVKDDIEPWHNEDGVLIIGIKDFLLNENSLDI